MTTVASPTTHRPRQDRVGALWRASFPGMGEPHSGALQRRIDSLGEAKVIEAIGITKARMRADAPRDEIHKYFWGVLRRMGGSTFVSKHCRAGERQGRIVSAPRHDLYLVEWISGGQELVTLDRMAGWSFFDSSDAMVAAPGGR